MASESFIHGLLLFLGLFPLHAPVEVAVDKISRISNQPSLPFSLFGLFPSQPTILSLTKVTIQVAYETSLGCLCPKPASFEIFGCKCVCKMYVCMYIAAFASILSTALEIEALSFAVNRFRKKTKERSERK